MSGVLSALALSKPLKISAKLGADDDDPIASVIGDAGSEILRRQIGIPPTLTIRPVFPMCMIVTNDLILERQGGH